MRTQCHACGLVRRLPAPTQLGAASASLARPRRLDAGAAAVTQDPQAATLQSEEPADDVHMADAAAGGSMSALATDTDADMQQSKSAPHQQPVKLSQRARRRAARIRSGNKGQAAAMASSEEQASSSKAQAPPGSAKQKKRAARSRRAHKMHAAREAAAAAATQQADKRRSAHEQRRKAAPPPRLPPFHERVRGSGWDVLLDARPHDADAASAQPDAHTRIAAALRALRGGHEVAVGLGPAGVLGPAAEPAQAPSAQ